MGWRVGESGRNCPENGGIGGWVFSSGYLCQILELWIEKEIGNGLKNWLLTRRLIFKAKRKKKENRSADWPVPFFVRLKRLYKKELSPMLVGWAFSGLFTLFTCFSLLEIGKKQMGIIKSQSLFAVDKHQ